MRNWLLGFVSALAMVAGLAGWLWYIAPERLPQEWRRNNPNSTGYRPALYRWKDDQGHSQISDQPPTDRPFEVLDIDPDTNQVPLRTDANTPP